MIQGIKRCEQYLGDISSEQAGLLSNHFACVVVPVHEISVGGMIACPFDQCSIHGLDYLCLSSMHLSIISAITTEQQSTSQPLLITPLALDTLQVKIANFGHGDCFSFLCRCYPSNFHAANWTDERFPNQVGTLPRLLLEMLLELPNAMMAAVDIWVFGCTESLFSLRCLSPIITLILTVLGF
jgi:hypothetical protein